MRRLASVLAVLAWTATSTLAAAQSMYDGVAVERDVMVAARDGVLLATDIYRPTRDGRPVTERLPVLLQRTPYNKGGAGLVRQAEFFASHGYVVVLQDTRGRYKSQGVFSKYYDYDALDGYDVIAWLASQAYSDGQVGMWGTSYGAHTQADPAKLSPPGLRTIVLNQGGMSNAWDHSVRWDGAFELGRQLTWAWRQLQEETKDSAVAEMLEREKVHDWYSAAPLRKGLNPLSVAPNFEDYYLDQATRADYDDYWKGLGLNWEEYYEQTSDIPMLHIGGWYDMYVRTTENNFLSLSRLKQSPIRMLIGPWTHGGNGRSFAGDVEFGSEAAAPGWPTEFHLRWFDHFLKGQQNGIGQEPKVRVFVMGGGVGTRDENGRLLHGGYWRDAEEWPLPDTRFTNYYFHGDGTLRPEIPGEGGPHSTTYTYDPEHPVPTIGGGVSSRLGEGAFDQREHPDIYGSRPPYLPLKSRRDIVIFETPPLAEDVQIIGPIVIKLFASSTAVDTDFTAKLVDVYPASADYPSGFDMNLTDGIIRARYRGRRHTAELIKPGRIYEFVIEPFSTANIFQKGHRIRVEISSSNFPRFDVNPNTGEPLGLSRRVIKADNTIYHTPEHPSHIVLPIVPFSER